MKRINARKKFTIAIALLLVSILAITGAIIGIYAASNQGLGSKFQISYKLNDDIAVEVSAKYEPELSSEVNLGSVRFDLYSTEDEAVLGTKDVIWLAPSRSVMFTYTFKNISKSQKVFITPSWANVATDVSNLTIWCETPTTSNYISAAGDLEAFATELPVDTEIEIKILFSVEVDNVNAYVSSSEVGGLTFNLSHVD